MADLAFAGMNLRRNPFGEPPPEDRASLVIGEIGEWFELLREELDREGFGQNGMAGLFGRRQRRSRLLLQFLGPSGSGKSTFLLALRDQFPQSRLLTWCPHEGWSPPPRFEPGPLGAPGPLLLDDAQEMSRRVERLAFRYQVVAAATQADLAPRFGRAGFRVETVFVTHGLDEGRLRKIVARRMEWARRGTGSLPAVGDATLRGLLLEHGVNVRAIQADLYGMFQQLEERE